jgi:hypothetical protein
MKDRLREAKATGLPNLPCHRADANAAWLEIIMAATDLVAWTKLIGFTDHPDLATCEIATFCYRVRSARLRLNRSRSSWSSSSRLIATSNRGTQFIDVSPRRVSGGDLRRTSRCDAAALVCPRRGREVIQPVWLLWT